MKRKAILSYIAIIIILIITIPFPHRINVSTKAMFEGSSDAYIEIKGYYLNYLIKEDRFKGKVIISPYSLDDCSTAIFDKGSGIIFGGFGKDNAIYSITTLGRYNKKLNHFTHMQVFFDKKFERILIKDHTLDKDTIYISYDENYTVNDNVKFFSLD